MPLQMFHPFDQLATKLLDLFGDDEDGAHDLSHIVRVWRNAKSIHSDEGGDLEALAAAVLLHDCIQVAKDSPLRSKASLLAAKEARVRLEALAWEPSRIDIVASAIESHSFSAGVAPTSIEGCSCKTPIVWTPSVLAASHVVSILQAVLDPVCMTWLIQREKHACSMILAMRWTTFPRSC